MKGVGLKGCGKSFFEECKSLKKCAFKLYGFGYLFATPKIKSLIYSSIIDFVNDLFSSTESDIKNGTTDTKK